MIQNCLARSLFIDLGGPLFSSCVCWVLGFFLLIDVLACRLSIGALSETAARPVGCLVGESVTWSLWFIGPPTDDGVEHHFYLSHVACRAREKRRS